MANKSLTEIRVAFDAWVESGATVESPFAAYRAAWTAGRMEPVSILRALLAADERGQGQPWTDAMERAKDFVEAQEVAGR